MEYGSFQNLRLSQLDFNESETENSFEFKNLEPRSRVSKSSSFDALMAQNEDLSARLKVALRRLTEVETENTNLLQENEDLRSTYQAMQDQLLVWKEKDKIWKSHEASLQESLRKLEWQSKIDRDSFVEKTDELKAAKSEIERFQRYHEKIQKIVKPYIQQLKGYSKSLEQEHKDTLRQNDQLQSEIRILESKLNNQLQSSTIEIEKTVQEKNQLIEIFESERSSLKDQIKSQSEELENLRLLTNKLERALERNDELENLVVVLRRSKEDAEKRFINENESNRNLMLKAKNEARESELKLNDALQNIERLSADNTHLTQKIVSHQEQLTTLRFLWTQKSEENEKLAASIAALEKINQDLSEKLNQLRSN